MWAYLLGKFSLINSFCLIWFPQCNLKTPVLSHLPFIHPYLCIPLSVLLFHYLWFLKWYSGYFVAWFLSICSITFNLSKLCLLLILHVHLHCIIFCTHWKGFSIPTTWYMGKNVEESGWLRKWVNQAITLEKWAQNYCFYRSTTQMHFIFTW